MTNAPGVMWFQFTFVMTEKWMHGNEMTLSCYKFHLSLIIWTAAEVFVMNRNRHIYNLWCTIQDIIGPATEWPHAIRRLFWTQNLQHFSRILLCAFVYVNGLNPDILYEWVELMHLARDRAAFNHIRALFRLFEHGHYSHNLYGWNVSQRQYQYLDGRIRIYKHRSRRQ